MAPCYLAGRPSLGPANSVIFILSVFPSLPPCPAATSVSPPRGGPGVAADGWPPAGQDPGGQPGPRARAAPGRARRSPRSRGHVSSPSLSHTPVALAALGGPAAPREPSLVFQSRRAGIFSVPQISAMARARRVRWHGVGARWGLRGGRGTGGRRGEATGGRERERPRSPVPAPHRRLPWGQEKGLSREGGEKTVQNVKSAHKTRLAGWETCRILLEHWPGPHGTGVGLTRGASLRSRCLRRYPGPCTRQGWAG